MHILFKPFGLHSLSLRKLDRGTCGQSLAPLLEPVVSCPRFVGSYVRERGASPAQDLSVSLVFSFRDSKRLATLFLHLSYAIRNRFVGHVPVHAHI